MTVIREGVIRLRLETTKARLESPAVDAAAKAYKEVERAQQQTAKATEEVGKKATEATKATQEFGVKTVASFREAGEGAFRMMRGLALLSASGSDDLKQLIKHVALAQGAFDVFAGGFKIYQNLSGILGGPVTLAIAGVTAAVNIGAAAWSKWQKDAAAAAAAVEERFKRLQQNIVDAAKSRNERLAELDRRGQRDIGFALTPGEREGRLRAAIAAEQAEAAALEQRTRGRVATRAGALGQIEDTRALVKSNERQADLQRDLFNLQKEQADAARESMRHLTNMAITGAASVPVPGLNAFAVQGAVMAQGAALGGIDAATNELTRKFQELIDTLLRMVDEGTDRAKRSEDALNQAFIK